MRIILSFLQVKLTFFEHFNCCLGLIFKANVLVLSISVELVLNLVLTGLSVHFNVLIMFDHFLLLVYLDLTKLFNCLPSFQIYLRLQGDVSVDVIPVCLR